MGLSSFHILCVRSGSRGCLSVVFVACLRARHTKETCQLGSKYIIAGSLTRGSDEMLAGLALNERGLEAKIDARGLMPFTRQLLIEN